jgi:uncharacterized protein (DUF1501 family)
MTRFSRRDFIKCCSATAGAVLATAPAARLGFAAPDANDYDTLVVVFLRGGMDGLTLFSPGGNHADRDHYVVARQNTHVPLVGENAGLPVSNDQWRFHPRAAHLRDLYQAGQLAVVLGAGMPAPVTRSHFDAQANMELGLAGQGVGAGWLTRVLASSGLPGTVLIPAISAGSLTATALLGSTEAITMGSGGDFRLDSAAWSWNSRDHYDPGDLPASFRGFVETLPDFWAGNSPLLRAGQQTLDALDVIRPIGFDDYMPANGADYGNSGFAAQLRMIAQLIKTNVGLRIAAIDIGGWDTHNGQNYYFGEQTAQLSQALGAFYTDLNGAGASNFAQRTTVVAMSEFGRRVNENADGGTDHGYGNLMLALGNSVNGGTTYGEFPGLAGDQLFEGADIDVSTDYRRVLSEALIRRLGNPNVYYAFPDYNGYAPLNIFQGADLPPGDFGNIFANGFENS